MRRLTMLLAVLALSGCAPLVVDAGPRGGVVVHVITAGPFHNEDEALVLADANCRRYGRAAQMTVPVTAIDGGDASLPFDCVPPR